MENASKALFIAAGVIIALMVISLGVYLFITFGQAASDTHEQVREYQLNQFNNQYTSYQGRTNLTIHDVVTVANMATKNNIYYELATSNRNSNGTYYIAVYLDDYYLSNKIQSGLGEHNRPIEKGYGDSTDVINEDNNKLIKNHVTAMMVDPFEHLDEDNLPVKIMPQIECKKVEINQDSRQSI